MTLVAALGCTDGVIIAADSAGSDSDSGTKQPVRKIRLLSRHGIVYGGSGDVGLLQTIYDALEGLPLKLTLKRIRQEIKKLVVPALAESKQLWVQYPRQGFHEPPAAILLMTGILEGRPWILEIERDGRDTMYGEDFGYFAAIGSGKPWAQAMFRPHLGTATTRDLRVGKVLMYRLLEDSIELAEGGLAKPIHMMLITLDGQCSEVTLQELESISQTCELWRSLERESLGAALSPSSSQSEGGTAIPAPISP